MASHAIEVKNLYKIFGPRGVDFVDAVKKGMGKAELNEQHGHVLGLQDINISMPAGSVMVVMGLSGSGKSTLIRHINRLIDPTAGEVLYDGVDVCKMNDNDLREFRRHKTAMVFQKFALLPHRTVLDNTVYGLEIQGVERKESEKRARGWIERVGLKGFENHYPNQLSGGMQQRVGLARALTNDADILLMDEAYSALDPLIRVDMQTVLLDLQKELKKTVVFITHDLDEALRLGDKIAILRDGRVVQQGTGQEIVLSPADDYITAFVKEVNRGRVINVETIMRPISGNAEGVALATGTVLESAARTMTAARVGTAHVVDENGRPIGALDLSTVIAAMVTPVSHEDRAAA
ncbi:MULTISPECIES: glycine betaine/L-proline ABC transporter ATP-binding protein [Ensifer]|uniref:Quaternary amine transport ATP-binding protein n=1 Tax=Ensifer adhaerens TaxID=106592 RepID=A0ABY8HK00_ENSAD|nr:MULTISPECIES: glycine betaine/L-proline ABC transporter ATP-binding protein [Ensifer]ANK72716.1 proline/glycine betaine ABC transporter ATP-binding protein [Ensifer adhaerens]KDP76338.1 glycine/betaine ABC transporter ATPase [Ensifer adhaerens]KQX32906.1 proline/glycine betaine ABC transporter ATP-binding protein [Ensifer sp. Root423]KQZ58472.1 proline/glycine betaine ABC transporter ATP-binding protein [Ensifer sp. Root558]MBD9540513.1 glycine betaine/L-proline ABC transporter ATP-binding 